MNVLLNEKMLRLHELICRKRTGTPEQLARKLDCCKRSALYKLEQLKEHGFPIAWDTYRQTYYYTVPVSVNISIVLGEKEMRTIIGGCAHALSENSYPGAKKLHWLNRILPCISRIQKQDDASIPG